MLRNLRTWGLQVVVLAVAFTLLFGGVFGKRGLVLIVFVAVLSLVPPTLVWMRTRAPSRSQ